MNEETQGWWIGAICATSGWGMVAAIHGPLKWGSFAFGVLVYAILYLIINKWSD